VRNSVYARWSCTHLELQGVTLKELVLQQLLLLPLDLLPEVVLHGEQLLQP
jgi:hypothetical protein